MSAAFILANDADSLLTALIANDILPSRSSPPIEEIEPPLSPRAAPAAREITLPVDGAEPPDFIMVA